MNESKRFRRGLVVGKFCPLHPGHMLVIDPVVAALAGRPYAHTFVCAPDFPFVQDGTRRDAAFRERQHRWYLAHLNAAGTVHTVLRGPLEARLEQACALLASS